jgi:hypothetical protein
VFEPREQRKNPMLLFLIQSIAVPIMVGLLTGPIFVVSAALFGIPPRAALMGNAGIQSQRLTRPMDVVLTIVVILAIGFFVGRFAGRRWPDAISSGTWIWVIPVVAFAYSLSSGWHHPLVRDHVLALYFQGTIGSDEGLQFLFSTLPAFSSLGYSLGQGMQARVR